mmetsp:Transcript_105659/g.340768  ORF Transcript_105659/g.340768 Transcript_105659/m.340768 type:complete len:86 (+) Transcript_105659:336-593(+)
MVDVLVVKVVVFVVEEVVVKVLVAVVDVVVVVERNLWKHQGTWGTCELAKQHPCASHSVLLMPNQPQLVFSSFFVAQSCLLGGTL